MMGSGTGGNIVYHADLHTLDLDFAPVKIVRLILNHPFFGDVLWSKLELRLAEDKIIPLHETDFLWHLALPEGTDRDHDYSNVVATAAAGSRLKEKIGKLPRCLMRRYNSDPLLDRKKEAAVVLAAHDVDVVAVFSENGHHGVEIFDYKMAEILYNVKSDL